MAGTELAVLDSAALAAMGYTEQDLMDAGGVIGLEAARPEDFQIPRLQLSQAMSPQLLRSKAEYIPGLMVGQYYNTVTQEIYGDTINVIPVRYNFSRLLFLDNQLKCQSKNGRDGGSEAPLCDACPHSKWGSGKDGNGTACKEYRNWLVLEATTGQPMSMSFKSASLVVAKTWATLISGRKFKLPNGQSVPAPAFSTVYELRSVEKTSPRGTFFIPAVKPIGPASNESMRIGAEMFRSFKGELSDMSGHEE